MAPGRGRFLNGTCPCCQSDKRAFSDNEAYDRYRSVCASRCASISIRKYVSRILDLGEISFLKGRQVSVEERRLTRLREIAEMAQAGPLSELLERAVRDRLNILVSGGGTTGETTVARALLSVADPRERLVTIEDALELNLPRENNVALIAEGSERR